MAIQTAGEQKYYDFIEERARSLRTGGAGVGGRPAL